MRFWASSSPNSEDPARNQSSDDSVPTPPPPPPRRAAPSTNFNPRRTLSRDEQAERELTEFLHTLTAEPVPSSPTDATVSPPASSPASSASISPDSLYPTDMSCRQAFDSAFYCQSLGGQFNNLYRYGGVKKCSDHWSAFWFCMRMKSYAGVEREAKIQDFYRKMDVKYKMGPSSEDVWEMRREPLRGAFSQDPFADDHEDTRHSGLPTLKD
ncbi:MAG: hypothetical protein M1833_003309 [Piccolia ochrophora]|nr:MAG: hypothetical protein M1833_003309 [Piccolia ochrophora]